MENTEKELNYKEEHSENNDSQNNMQTENTDKASEETKNAHSENEIEDQAHLTEEEGLQLEIEHLKQKLEEQKDKYLRLYADFDNFRKRSAKDRLELMDAAGKDIILKLLPVLDDFDRAITSADKSDDNSNVKEGLSLIHKKLWNSLKSSGLKRMQTLGEDFNAELHEAITEVETPDKKMKGKVIDEVEGGFYLNDKIIRFAKVVVGK